MSFDKAFEFIKKWEGEYINDPNDAGGETKYGISKRSYPHLNIRALTLEQAKEIYKKDFWIPSKANLLPEPLALAVFDFAVNAGVSRAMRTLQSVVGTDPDGIWGKKTVAAINAALRTMGSKKLAIKLCQERAEFYVGIVTRSSTQIRFLKGWLRRVFDLISEIS